VSFPFDEKAFIVGGKSYSWDQIHPLVTGLIMPERLEKIRRVVKGRTFGLATVTEHFFDRGNVSAVGMGFPKIEVIQDERKFKEANRVTKGAEKWMEMRQWTNTTECLTKLKQEGFQIWATHLSPNSVPLEELEIQGKIALVFGNEKTGVSDTVLDHCDRQVRLPMPGFVQSFNVSVAAAIGFYHMHLHRRGLEAMSEHQKKILECIYCMRTQESAVDFILRDLRPV
jgi:tRNA (guanosine-2'-O-)-methyltransferase